VLHVAHVLHGTAMAAMGQGHRIGPPRAAPADLHRPTLKAIGGMISGLGDSPASPASTGAGGPPVMGLMSPPTLPPESQVPQGLMGLMSRSNGS
jgi:hypothetical protein